MPVKVDDAKCSGCKNCYEVCPEKVYDWEDAKKHPVVARLKDCVECGLCISECPEQAISWLEYQVPSQ